MRRVLATGRRGGGRCRCGGSSPAAKPAATRTRRRCTRRWPAATASSRAGSRSSSRSTTTPRRRRWAASGRSGVRQRQRRECLRLDRLCPGPGSRRASRRGHRRSAARRIGCSPRRSRCGWRARARSCWSARRSAGAPCCRPRRSSPTPCAGVVSLSGERTVPGDPKDVLPTARHIRLPVLLVGSRQDGYTRTSAPTPRAAPSGAGQGQLAAAAQRRRPRRRPALRQPRGRRPQRDRALPHLADQPWSIVTGTPVNARPSGPEQERDASRDLLGLDQPLDRVRREDHLLEHALLGDAVRLGLVGDLRLDQRRAHVAGADRGRADAVLGALQRERLAPARARRAWPPRRRP